MCSSVVFKEVERHTFHRNNSVSHEIMHNALENMPLECYNRCLWLLWLFQRSSGRRCLAVRMRRSGETRRHRLIEMRPRRRGEAARVVKGWKSEIDKNSENSRTSSGSGVLLFVCRSCGCWVIATGRKGGWEPAGEW